VILDEVVRLARKQGVGFSCVYCESDDSWYFTVNSAAPSECWMGRNYQAFAARLQREQNPEEPHRTVPNV
jgi:hypothetical protein